MTHQTTHSVFCGDARDLSEVADESVNLVVTSPPYPMIEMWDEAFAAMNDDVEPALEAGDGDRAFDRMHAALDDVWAELERVVAPSGIVCVNVGDATRKIGGDFQLFPNHARIVSAFRDLGFSVLPDVLWRKPTNKASKFMGSGMIPPNAYVTLEHEYALVFRKGGPRSDYDHERRYESAYFWEERNEWFSDVWTDLQGVSQELSVDSRERSGAFPLDLPLRLIRMFSIRGDTVLDPFLGTGTTTVAAMLAGRDSIGVDRDAEVLSVLADRVDDIEAASAELVEERVADHEAFVAGADREFKYESERYGFPVTTSYETDIRFYTVGNVARTDDGYVATHEPADGL